MHDPIRGDCLEETRPDPAEECARRASKEARPAFLALPADCRATPPRFEVRADSWEEPSPPFGERKAVYESAGLNGQSPVHLSGCGEVEFKPTIEAKPTTTNAESPAGLEFDLRQPQQAPATEPLAGRATGILKDASVSFPAGMQVNPSQAAGLGACSEEEIGFEGEAGPGEEAGALRFSQSPRAAPMKPRSAPWKPPRRSCPSEAKKPTKCSATAKAPRCPNRLRARST